MEQERETQQQRPTMSYFYTIKMKFKNKISQGEIDKITEEKAIINLARKKLNITITEIETEKAKVKKLIK